MTKRAPGQRARAGVPLSELEKETVRLWAEYRSPTKVAAKMDLSVAAVRSTLQRARVKTGKGSTEEVAELLAAD